MVRREGVNKDMLRQAFAASHTPLPVTTSPSQEHTTETTTLPPLFSERWMQEYDASLTQMMYLVEKEVGVTITGSYPIMKFFAQIDEMQRDAERQKKEQDKMERKMPRARRR